MVHFIKRVIRYLLSKIKQFKNKEVIIGKIKKEEKRIQARVLDKFDLLVKNQIGLTKEKDYADYLLGLFYLKNESKHVVVNLLEKLSLFLFQTLNKELDTSKLESELLELASEISYEYLSISQWKALYYITNLRGNFVLANDFRKQALNKALSYETKPKLSQKEAYYLFTAYLDENKIEEAKVLIDKLQKKIIKVLPIRKMNMYLNLFEENSKAVFKRNKNLDKTYYNLINGKSVAIVGPAPSDEMLGKEIDKFDIVIRLNYRGDDFMPEHNEFGSRIDVSYYNTENAKNLAKMNQIDFLKKLKFIVFKGNNELYSRFKNNKVKKLIMRDEFVFLGSLNMIPLTIIDILAYNPKRVKVFKTNFFLSKNLYAKGYQLEKNMIFSLSKRWRSFAMHNVVSQIKVVKNLYHNGRVKLDKSCQDVLDLPEKKYIKEIQRIFS